MKPPVEEKTVLITGANKGIGFETARQLAERGFHVFLTARNREAGLRAAESIEEAGVRVSFVELDVTNSDGVRRAAEEVSASVNCLDVLINNAGVYPDGGFNILTISRERLTGAFQTNSFGPIEITQAFLPLIRQARAGRVINVSSGYGALGGLSADVPSYCLSKLALNGATIMLAEALRPDGVAVNAMCPGWVRTDMGGRNAPNSVAEGVDTAVWLAAEAPQSLTGKFVRDRRIIEW